MIQIVKVLAKQLADKVCKALEKDDRKVIRGFADYIHAKYGCSVVVSERYYEGYDCNMVLFPLTVEQETALQLNEKHPLYQEQKRVNAKLFRWFDLHLQEYDGTFTSMMWPYPNDCEDDYVVGPMPDYIAKARAADDAVAVIEQQKLVEQGKHD
jgi:hypothetical protein